MADDDSIPIIADRIIIEYNFANVNKVQEEKIKMHDGDDEKVEEEEKYEDKVNNDQE